MPWLGGNLTTLREGVVALNTVATDGIGPLMDLSAAVDLGAFRQASRAERLAALTRAIAPLQNVNTVLASASNGITEVDTEGNIGPVSDGFTLVRDSLDRFARASSGLSGIAVMVPSLNGAEPSGPWTVVITSTREGGRTETVAYLHATTTGGRFAVTDVTDGTTGAAPDAAAPQTITVDVATLQLLTQLQGSVTVTGVGPIAADQVDDFAMTGAYAQAPNPADAQKSIGAFASIVVTRLLN
ncbi:hypothetical protein [Cryobacterium zhongshanensis]|uniref:Uncharacterized protein n=1 Tax=Cryobacterium zhongshanensis TaxID=2928153 RepID=A0AA41QTX7_9MICO|nr:hypothetical protein [Cryobacterium zhongshanensis]MCI4657625.1 hypothetical protein [Cryobacterium zhongshanensis]